jgi:hypothetical protein
LQAFCLWKLVFREQTKVAEGILHSQRKHLRKGYMGELSVDFFMAVNHKGFHSTTVYSLPSQIET